MRGNINSCALQPASAAYVSLRQHTSAYVSIRQQHMRGNINSCTLQAASAAAVVSVLYFCTSKASKVGTCVRFIHVAFNGIDYPFAVHASIKNALVVAPVCKPHQVRPLPHLYIYIYIHIYIYINIIYIILYTHKHKQYNTHTHTHTLHHIYSYTRCSAPAARQSERHPSCPCCARTRAKWCGLASTRQYLYFCTSKASKLSTCARTRGNARTSSW